MRERFEDRIEGVLFEIDYELLEFKVPSLLLQPLLENAFRHGVEKHLGAAKIVVRCETLEMDRMRLSIECNLGQIPDAPRFGTGITNLRERLAMRFGARASLEIVSNASGGVRSLVTLPCIR